MQRFRKICSFVLFFFILFVNGNSFSEVVKKVEIKGNARISQETIIVFGDISVGKDYNISDVNSLIKKLYDTLFGGPNWKGITCWCSSYESVSSYFQ